MISLIGFKLLRRFFFFKEYPNDRKVKLVPLKLKKYAFLWCENLKKQRAHESINKIKSCDKIKRELERRFLFEHYQ
jgi:hypothetical protein